MIYDSFTSDPEINNLEGLLAEPGINADDWHKLKAAIREREEHIRVRGQEAFKRLCEKFRKGEI